MDASVSVKIAETAELDEEQQLDSSRDVKLLSRPSGARRSPLFS
jgi:hypothetical protein